MIDEIDYFPKRERHNKKKKVGSGWEDIKKQKMDQDEPSSKSPSFPEKKQQEKKRNQQNSTQIVYTAVIYQV